MDILLVDAPCNYTENLYFWSNEAFLETRVL